MIMNMLWIWCTLALRVRLYSSISQRHLVMKNNVYFKCGLAVDVDWLSLSGLANLMWIS